MCHVHKAMKNMGQTSTEHWASSWSPVKVYDAKEGVGMEYTMLESYFDSMCAMKSDVSSKQSIADGKITPDNNLRCHNSLISSEKQGFEAEVAVTSAENAHTCSPHKTIETINKNIFNEKSAAGGIHYLQEVSFPSSLPKCVIKEELDTVLEDVE
jgi:hypothetical protein